MQLRSNVDFCFLTPNDISMPDCLLYNAYGLTNNSECLFIGAPLKHYKEFRKAFKKSLHCPHEESLGP